MHVHILGVAGTFMAGLAVLAKELNIKVTGSDKNVYPPMSTQLEELGVQIYQGYDDISALEAAPDYVIVGNVMTRGMPIIEALLNQKQPYLSGPEWLSRFVLQNRKVIAVSGTHGKTTTSSMVAWILEYAGLNPGFLIGGIPNNFGCSARLGSHPFFVVEADEYDSAFFDKRSKFVHYQPWALIINNIEFDHADIFPDLAAIQRQFHHVIRIVPSEGLIVYPDYDTNVEQVLAKGCWSKTTTLSAPNVSSITGWSSVLIKEDGSAFSVLYEGEVIGTVQWNLGGDHNRQNALAAIAATSAAGVDPALAVEALASFKGVKRRMEVKGTQGNVTVYDDFAHHPTAIQLTLAGLRAKVGDQKIVAVLDIRSNTMKAGYHQETLIDSVREADHVYFYQGQGVEWEVEKLWKTLDKPGGVYTDIQKLLQALLDRIEPHDQVLFMSNGGFEGIQNTFLERLADLERLVVLGGL